MSHSASIIKPHIRRLAGSGRLLEWLIIERSLETAFTEYPAHYRPPDQHIVVAPTTPVTSLEWRKDGSARVAKALFTPDDLILNPRGCFTRPRWDRDTRFTLVAIRPEGIAAICDELELPAAEVPKRFHFQNPAMASTVHRLVACFDAEPDQLLSAQTLERLLLRQLAGECLPIREAPHQLSRSRLSAVHELVRERLAHPISLDEMAAAAGYSPSRFLSLFRNATGLTPYQYVIHQRIEKAGRLLSSTRLPLSQIALDCGFSDQSHLQRQFKRHVGHTPLQYRARS